MLPVGAELQAAMEVTIAASVIPVINIFNFLLISFAFIISFTFLLFLISLSMIDHLCCNRIYMHFCSPVHENILAEYPYLKLRENRKNLVKKQPPFSGCFFKVSL